MAVQSISLHLFVWCNIVVGVDEVADVNVKQVLQKVKYFISTILFPVHFIRLPWYFVGNTLSILLTNNSYHMQANASYCISFVP